MPVIQTLNATNASFTLQYGKYTDFNLWVIVIVISLALMILSRYMSQKDDVGKFLISVLSIIFALAAVWGSLGVAHFDYTQSNMVTVNSTGVDNQSITYTYIYPVQQVVSSPWLTGLCIVLLIFTFLNALDILIVIMQKPSIDDMKKRGGRGIRI